MEKQKLQTRFDEVRIRIDDPKNLEGKMPAEDVRRKWMEDFVDEQTGEIVSVERTEFVSPRGKRLTKDDVSHIMFHMQAGEIKDVLVTNQIRPAVYSRDTSNKYEVVAADARSKKRLLVHAKGIPMALQIAIDYCEQTMVGTFTIGSVKVADDYKVVSLTPKDNGEDGDELIYYAVTISFYCDDSWETDLFLTAAKDADTACAIVRALIDSNESRRKFYGDNYRITVSKNSPITDVVPPDFCEKYVKMYETEKYIMDGVRVGQIPA